MAAGPDPNVNKYEDLTVIGTGAYGTVYKAKDVRTGNYVALKRIRIHIDEEGMPMSTIREISSLRNLECYENEHIVKLYDVCIGKQLPTEIRLFLVFEFIDQDLNAYLKRFPEPGLPPDLVQDLFHQLLTGLDFLHSRLILHRDIKPQNVLVTKDGILKLCDFGLSRMFQNRMTLTSVVVTLWYRAPEVLLNTQYALAVDVWSCACIFYELVNRRPMFSGVSDIDQLNKIFDILGVPSEDEWPSDISLQHSAFLSRYQCSSSPDSGLRRRKRNLHEIVGGELCQEGVDLLEKMLVFDPSKRISSGDALRHPYFANLPLPPLSPSATSSIASGTTTPLHDRSNGQTNPPHLSEGKSPPSSQTRSFRGNVSETGEEDSNDESELGCRPHEVGGADKEATNIDIQQQQPQRGQSSRQKGPSENSDSSSCSGYISEVSSSLEPLVVSPLSVGHEEGSRCSGYIRTGGDDRAAAAAATR